MFGVSPAALDLAGYKTQKMTNVRCRNKQLHYVNMLIYKLHTSNDTYANFIKRITQ